MSRIKKEQIAGEAIFTLGINLPDYYERYKQKKAARRHQARKIERRLTNYELQDYINNYEEQ